MESDFDHWLGQKLTAVNPDVDLDVFVQYIKGILETETEDDDILESMGGLLAEIIVNTVPHFKKFLNIAHGTWRPMICLAIYLTSRSQNPFYLVGGFLP